MATISENLTELIAQKERISNEVSSQSTLIAQIKTVLEQKASGEVPPSKLAGYIDGSLTEITASDLDGITSIRNYAFYNAKTLASVDIPDSVTSIGNNAFSSCSSLTSVTIPSKLTIIGSNAFQGCTKLASITLPKTLTNLGTYTFADSGLTTVIFEDNSVLTAFYERVFWNCQSLTTITIPNSVDNIVQYAFDGCSKLANLTIPSSVTNIGMGALRIGSTTNKATITFLGTTPPSIQSNTFQTSKLNQIIVPKGYGEVYKSATNWSNFADYITEATE